VLQPLAKINMVFGGAVVLRVSLFSRTETYPDLRGQQGRARDEKTGQLFAFGDFTVFFWFCDAADKSVLAARRSSGRSETETGNGQSGLGKGHASYA
jgi:hypothetical protein